jgi:hypothetical protein
MYKDCSDARDRIFVLAGIGVLSPDIKVNYVSSVEDIYANFACSIIEYNLRKSRWQFMVL